MNEISKFNDWNPFRDFEALQDRYLNQIFKTRNGDPSELATREGDTFDWSPAVDVAEDDKEFVITADLPEVNKEDIKITTTDGRLTISGERTREEKHEDKTWHRVERSYGKYSRSFRIPEEVEADNISAAYKDSVLTVHLPKSSPKKDANTASEIPVK
jgi:HSP20 family protein